MATEEFIAEDRPNRLLDVLRHHVQLESAHRIDNPAAGRNSPDALEHKRHFLENLIRARRSLGKPNPGERGTLIFLRHELRRVKALQRPNVFNRILFNKYINRAWNWLRGRGEILKVHREGSADDERRTALDRNSENLHKQMRSIGINSQIEVTLKKFMATGMDEFAVRHYDIHRPGTDFILHFKKFPDTDAYYFEKVKATPRLSSEEVALGMKTPRGLNLDIAQKGSLDVDDLSKMARGERVVKSDKDGHIVMLADFYKPEIRKILADPELLLEKYPILEMRSAPDRKALVSDLLNGIERKVTLLVPGDEAQQLSARMYVNATMDKLKMVFFDKNGVKVDPAEIVQNRQQARAVLQKITNVRKNRNPGVSRTTKAH